LSLIGLEIQWQLAVVFRKSHSVRLARRWRQRRYMAGSILLACRGDRGPAYMRCRLASGRSEPEEKTKDDYEKHTPRERKLTQSTHVLIRTHSKDRGRLPAGLTAAYYIGL
jgi:hypothetical protein